MVAPDIVVTSFNAVEPALDFLLQRRPLSPPEQFAGTLAILLDLNLPGLDGWAFVEELERWPPKATENLQVFILTASINPDDKERARKYPSVRGFMVKPLKREQLSAILK